MLALLVMLLLAAVVKLVVAVCGHTITWRLSIVIVLVLLACLAA